MNNIDSTRNQSIMSHEDIQNLDQKWQTIIAPNVQVGNGLEDSKYEKEKEYNFGETLNKIKTFQSQGKSICLFIGRTPYEQLPSDCDEAKDNELWISADISLIPCGYGTEYAHYNKLLLPSVNLKERLHLWIDLNQQQGIELIRGLFDKIVIDQSTLKLLCNDFPKRSIILLHSAESELIFEGGSKTGFGLGGGSEALTPTYFFYDPYSIYINLSHVKQFFPESIQQRMSTRQITMAEISPEIGKIINPMTLTAIKNHLKTIYKNIEEHRAEKYPYTTNYNCENDQADYFVVRNPLTHPSFIDVVITSCNVHNGTLGIAFEPDWGRNPIAFRKSQDGLAGRVPLGIECKFVILQNDQVQKWENGCNRRFESTMDSIRLTLDNVNFS